MTISKYTDFLHFARDFFLYSSFHKVRSDNLWINDSWMHDILPILYLADNWCSGFNDTQFDSLHIAFRQTEYDDFSSDAQFLRFAIPRCLKLSVEGMFFQSLLLVGAFLKEFLYYMLLTRRCFRFHFTAYKAYAAVFKRAFESRFEEYGGMEGLESYLRISTRRGNFFDNMERFTTPQVQYIVEHCNEVDDDFNLNDYERSLLDEDEVAEFLDDQETDSEDGDNDPLNFQWPIRPEEVERKLETMILPMDDEEDFYDSPFIEDEFRTDLQRYTMALEYAAREEMDEDEFQEMMYSRLCPCCGVRCRMLASDLADKQAQLAIVTMQIMSKLRSYFTRFYWKCRSRIRWLFHFVLHFQRQIAELLF